MFAIFIGLKVIVTAYVKINSFSLLDRMSFQIDVIYLNSSTSLFYEI